jgi:hypothetical protein
MAMIAFYAGLFIGILLGFLLTSLLFLPRWGSRNGTLSDRSEDYAQVDPVEP